MLDMCAYDDMGGLLGENVIGNLEDLLSPEVRNNMEYLCDHIKRVEVALPQQTESATPKPPVSIRNLPAVDANGKSYRLEFLTVSPEYRQRQYCFVYGISNHAGGAERYEDMGLVKVNTCLAEDSSSSSPTVENMLHVENVYLGEPVFIADPNGMEEDSGVLLMTTKHGESDTTSLMIVDASNFEIQATIPAPFPLMFEFHGQFFPSP